MDVLKKQLERIQQQLTALSASQKMLTASLVAIMVITFLWWGRYAGNPELEPVINRSLTADDMINMKRVLQGQGVPVTVSGDQILVPADKKELAIAALAYEQVLPRDSQGSFEDVIGKMSPFTSDKLSDSMTNNFLQQKLANIIGQMNGVASATVFIDPTREHHIGGDTDPRASVSVRMRNHSEVNKKLA